MAMEERRNQPEQSASFLPAPSLSWYGRLEGGRCGSGGCGTEAKSYNSLKPIDNFRAILWCAGCPAMFSSSDSFGSCLRAVNFGGVTGHRS